MRYFLNILLIALLSLQVQAQFKQIRNPIVIPSEPHLGDSVFVRLQSWTSAFTYSSGYFVEHIRDSFEIYHCVRNTPNPEIRVYDDTLFLGVLDTGDYIVHFSIYESARLDTCEFHYPLDSVTRFTVTLPTGVKNLEEGQLRCYPNPTDGKLFIVFGDLNQEIPKFKVFDSRAINVKRGNLCLDQSGTGLIDFYELPKGLYIVQIQIGYEIYYGKVVRE